MYAILLLMLQQPVDDLSNYPPTAALQAFTYSLAQCTEQVLRYGAHMDWLHSLPDTYPDKDRWLGETERAWEAWLFLEQAKNPKQSEYGIRTSLRDLKEWIGEKRFWKGDMPPMLTKVEYPKK